MTGESSTGSNNSVTFFGGTIRNEGIFTQASQANYDLDGSSATGGGTIENTGIWNLTNSSNFANTYAGGVFNNSGTLNQSGGATYIYAPFNKLLQAHIITSFIYLQENFAWSPITVACFLADPASVAGSRQ